MKSHKRKGKINTVIHLTDEVEYNKDVQPNMGGLIWIWPLDPLYPTIHFIDMYNHNQTSTYKVPNQKPIFWGVYFQCLGVSIYEYFQLMILIREAFNK